MAIRNPRREELRRLDAKTLEARFRRIVGHGLGCSPFETEGVVGAVREVYGPALSSADGPAVPGRVTLVAVCADEPAGKPVADCEKRTVCLAVHRGHEDDRCLQQGGAEAFRQSRIPDLCQEALSQGALLTREDLAYRVFFVSPRTISRDLQVLRQRAPRRPIPLRSTVHDIGPVLTHRVRIVQLALEGKTTSQICRIMRHSPMAVANYVSTFTRCAQLAREGLEVGQIAFLLRRSRGLVEKYVQLLKQCAADKNLAYHLEELLRISRVGPIKKTARRGRR